MTAPLFVDLTRELHLLCVILGMGPALYYDIRSMHTVSQPLTQFDIAELKRIHMVVTAACLGLWVTGVALIGIRTGFDLAAFSPKLWAKLIVVTVLMLNAVVLAKWLMPKIAHSVGNRVIDLPPRALVPMTLCAGVSLSCWLLALALGASTILKTADWSLLAPVLIGGSAVVIAGVLGTTFILRREFRASNDSPQTVAVNGRPSPL